MVDFLNELRYNDIMIINTHTKGDHIMNQVNRYLNDEFGMYKYSEGPYVKYEDYMALLTKYQELQSQSESHPITEGY